MGKVEVFMPNMRGTCVTVGGRVHGLFLLNSKGSPPRTETVIDGDRDRRVSQADPAATSRSA